jgi:hypothetical protein
MDYLIVDERSGSRVTPPCATDQSIAIIKAGRRQQA